jgi:diaphanous 1
MSQSANPLVASQNKGKPPKVTRLGADRLKNVEMILSRIKVSGVSVKEALFAIDFTFLTVERTEVLKNAAPEKDEIDLFVGHPIEEPSMAAAPDLYYAEIC